MEQDINKTIDNVLDSLHAIKQVEPSPFLFAKIRYRIEERRSNSYFRVELPTWKWAVTFAFIISINIFGFYIYQPQSTQEIATIESEDVVAEITTENYDDIY